MNLSSARESNVERGTGADAAFAASAANAAASPEDADLHPLWIQLVAGLAVIGRPRALYIGMLRITLPSASGSRIFILEGRLAGLWAQELLRVVREANQRYRCIFDLQEVFYVDSNGEQALRMLDRYGASFITDSAYGKDLCKRLKLRRIDASNLQELQPQQEGEGEPGGHIPKATDANCSSLEMPGQQRSGCRE